MKLCIDVRMIDSSGIGTYIKNLLPSLVNNFNVILLGNKNKIKNFNFYKDITLIECKSKIYSLKEQIELFYKIPRCDFFWSPHYNIPLLPIKAKKRIVTIHDVYHLAFFKTLNFCQKFYAKFFLNTAIKKSDLIFTESEFTKQEIKKYLKIKNINININVFNNIINLEKFKPYKNKKILNTVKKKYSLPEEFLLFVGNVKPHKNLKNLLLAIMDLKINLVIVGKREGFITNDKKINKLLENNKKLNNRVYFTDYIIDEDIPIIYNLAKIFVFPSLYEGFGLPPLEAMACGCPTLVSNKASIPEICGNASIYFNPYNIEEIKNKIKYILENEELRKNLIKKGLNHVKKYSTKNIDDKLINLIKKNI